jgi:tripartite-type tricarboxylate transporter receptor subunit TctC
MREVIMKRYFVILLALLIAAAAFANGGAQGASGYPNRPIECISMGGPGSSTDLSLRLIAPELEKHLGVPIVVVNRPGSGDKAAAVSQLKNGKADGYTWDYWSLEVISSQTTIGEMKVIADAATDFTYSGSHWYAPFVVVVAKDKPWDNIEELAAAIKANPGTITWGRNGMSGADADFIRYMEQYSGGKVNPIDGMDAQKAWAAVIGGHLDVFVDYPSTSIQYYNEGAVKLVGIGSPERVAELPNVPTFKEQGFDIPIQSDDWGFWTNARTDKAIVEIFREALRKAANEDSFKEKVKQNGASWRFLDADQVTKNVLSYCEFYKNSVK